MHHSWVLLWFIYVLKLTSCIFYERDWQNKPFISPYTLFIRMTHICFFSQLKDPLSQRYEVKLPPGVRRSKTKNQSALYTTEYQPEPFGFIVRRKSNGRVMWAPLFSFKRCAVHYTGGIIIIFSRSSVSLSFLLMIMLFTVWSCLVTYISMSANTNNSGQMISVFTCIM